jgi:arylsulfatase A-like enzyme
LKPHILLVVFDTARADAFEPYGASPGASPAVAQLAARGQAHPAAFSTACWTVPSHASLFTGMLPRSGGFGHVGGQTPPGYRSVLQAHEADLLPSVLRDAGYATFGASTNLWISPESGFDTGFEAFRYLTGGRSTGIGRTDLRGRAAWVAEAIRAQTDDGARAVRQHLETWLGDRDDRPFFLFVNLVECHSPYLPPKPWTDLNALERARAAIEAQRHLTFGEIWKGSVGGFDIPAGAIGRMRRSYAASIRQLDDWLAQVMGLLDQHGLLDDTQVVVTSDHGENLGDGELIGHAFSLDDRLIRLPFVTAGPMDLDLPPLLSIADVPRVLARAAEIADHPWTDGPVGGPAVAQFDAPGVPDSPKIDEALELWGLGEEARERLITSFTCATDGRHKLVRRGSREELFDLDADPQELRPLVVGATVEQEHGTVLAPLRGALDRAEAEERTIAPSPHQDAIGAEDVDALEAQMRLLGYL